MWPLAGPNIAKKDGAASKSVGNPFWNFLDFWISMKFQAVIKSAASAASPKAKSREGSSRGAPGDGARWDDGGGRTTDRMRTTERGAPLELPSLDFAFGEAAPAADLITTWNFAYNPGRLR